MLTIQIDELLIKICWGRTVTWSLLWHLNTLKKPVLPIWTTWLPFKPNATIKKTTIAPHPFSPFSTVENFFQTNWLPQDMSWEIAPLGLIGIRAEKLELATTGTLQQLADGDVWTFWVWQKNRYWGSTETIPKIPPFLHEQIVKNFHEMLIK